MWAATADGERLTGGNVERFETRAMGSAWRLTLVHVPLQIALQAWRRVLVEVEAVEQALSRFRETSELTQLNRLAGTGRSVAVDSRLRRALSAADRASRLTGGRFDARVLSDLERLGFGAVDQGLPPGTGLTGLAGPRKPRRWLRVDGRSPEIGLDEAVDLGGIGKGLALRWAWAAVRASVPPDSGALLDAGGDLVLSGPSPDGKFWNVAIEDPRGRSEPPAIVSLRSGAIVTSSVVVNAHTDERGRRVHHLIDPATGEPGGEGLVSVTVAGRDPAWSEVWSKALFLSGAVRIADEARCRGLAAWWVREDGVLEMTPAGRQRTIWTRA
jgi:thiamine biosynthesis lipoprotein